MQFRNFAPDKLRPRLAFYVLKPEFDSTTHALTTYMLALLTGSRHSSLQGGEAAGGVQYRLLVRACRGDKAPLGDQVTL